MSLLPFAINGMGRIGRTVARIATHREGLRLVAVNDAAEASTWAHLLERDSVHGRSPRPWLLHGNHLRCEGAESGEIEEALVFRHRHPSAVPWEDSGARVVLETTGHFLRAEEAAGHLGPTGGGCVEKVLISGIADDPDLIWSPGLGLDAATLDPRARLVSAASCTTHCLALLTEVLDRGFGLRGALLNEVHGYTRDQQLLDGPHRDRRRARAAAINIIPTGTAAPAALGRLRPHLAGRIEGRAIRVPTPNVALLDLVAELEIEVTRDRVLRAFEEASQGPMQGVLALSHQPLVSCDYLGETHSAVIDSELIALLPSGDADIGSSRTVRVMAWYDNEWGYATRLVDLLCRWADDRA